MSFKNCFSNYVLETEMFCKNSVPEAIKAYSYPKLSKILFRKLNDFIEICVEQNRGKNKSLDYIKFQEFISVRGDKI